MTPEHAIQNEIRNAIADRCHVFRANVGEGWVGSGYRKLAEGMLIKDPRKLNTGLPQGFSDLFGWQPVEITADMVGTTIARFFAIEVKAPSGQPTKPQEDFIAAVARAGGLSGIARSVNDALNILNPPTTSRERIAMTSTEFLAATSRLGWTVPVAAREIGVTERSVSAWRNGHTPIPYAVERLLQLLIERLPEQTASAS